MVISGRHVSLPDFDASRAELIDERRGCRRVSREVAVDVEVGCGSDDSGSELSRLCGSQLLVAIEVANRN